MASYRLEHIKIIRYDMPIHMDCPELSRKLSQIEDETCTQIKVQKTFHIEIKGYYDDIDEAHRRLKQLNDFKCKVVFQSEKNAFEQKIQRLTNAVTNNKLKINAINTKIQEDVQNEDLIKEDVFRAEMSNVQSEVQEIKNAFEQKILELTNTISKLEMKAKISSKELEYIHNKDVISDIELENFYKCEEYVNCRQLPGKQPLHSACQLGRIDVAKKLIKNGIDVNIKDNNNSTPLIYASANGQKAIVEYLISKNADLDIKNTLNMTALSVARDCNFMEITEILINHGATA